MARDPRLDAAGARLRLAPHKCNILTAEIARPSMIGELLGEPPVRGVRLGHDHEPARVLVQPVDDARPGNAANAGEALAAMGDERVHKRSVQVSGAWVDDQPGRFVDHDEAVILVNHRESDRFAGERVRLHGRHLDLEALPSPHLSARIGYGPAVGRDPPGANEVLQPCPA